MPTAEGVLRRPRADARLRLLALAAALASLLPCARRDEVAEEIGTQYSLGYYPTNKAREGYHAPKG